MLCKETWRDKETIFTEVGHNDLIFWAVSWSSGMYALVKIKGLKPTKPDVGVDFHK